jgi:Acetyltransferase (isoleucine patch superfamily)
VSVVSKVFHKLGCFVTTIVSKCRWGKRLSIDGLLKKRHDTQIIISDGGKMILGKGIRFQRNVSLTATDRGTLKIGNNVSFNRNCIIISRENITIGDDVIFGPGVTIYDHDHIFSYDGIMDEYKYGSVEIEKGCWIASNVIILRNTHIGEGCVIGAGAIVKGEVPPHSLVTSNRELKIVPICKKNENENSANGE